MKNIELVNLFRQNKEGLLSTEQVAKLISQLCGKHLLQHPEEFAQLLVLAAKANVRSYLEIGMKEGWSFYVMTSYLAAVHGAVDQSLGIDVVNSLVDWPQYSEAFPDCHFRQMDSRNLKLTSARFDLALIDGSHRGEIALSDFNRVKDHCKMVAFHDIRSTRDRVGNVWRSLRDEEPKRRTWEFIKQTRSKRYMMGIGVIELRK